MSDLSIDELLDMLNDSTMQNWTLIIDQYTGLSKQYNDLTNISQSCDCSYNKCFIFEMPKHRPAEELFKSICDGVQCCKTFKKLIVAYPIHVDDLHQLCEALSKNISITCVAFFVDLDKHQHHFNNVINMINSNINIRCVKIFDECQRYIDQGSLIRKRGNRFKYENKYRYDIYNNVVDEYELLSNLCGRLEIIISPALIYFWNYKNIRDRLARACERNNDINIIHKPLYLRLIEHVTYSAHCNEICD